MSCENIMMCRWQFDLYYFQKSVNMDDSTSILAKGTQIDNLKP